MKAREKDGRASLSTGTQSAPTPAVEISRPLSIREELRQLEDMVLAQSKQVAEQRQQTQDLMQLCGQILHSVQIPVALPRSEISEPTSALEQQQLPQPTVATPSAEPRDIRSATDSVEPTDRKAISDVSQQAVAPAVPRSSKHVHFVGDEQDDRADLQRQTLGGLVADVRRIVSSLDDLHARVDDATGKSPATSSSARRVGALVDDSHRAPLSSGHPLLGSQPQSGLSEASRAPAQTTPTTIQEEMRNLEDMVRRVLVAIEMPAAAVPIADLQQQQQQLHSQPAAQSQAQSQSKEPQADDLPVSRVGQQDEKSAVAEPQSAEMQALQTERAALLQKLQGANEAIEVRNYCACWLCSKLNLLVPTTKIVLPVFAVDEGA
jgi:hypothetical protein